MFVSRDSEAKGDLISWWEGDDPAGDSQLSVESDEAALVVSNDDETVLSTHGPGRHAVQVPENASIAFVTTVPVVIEAAAELEDLDDAEVVLEATVRVADPTKMFDLLEKLAEDESLEDWLGVELLLHVGAAATEAGVDADGLAENPSAVTAAALERARAALTAFGVEVVRIDEVEVEPEAE